MGGAGQPVFGGRCGSPILAPRRAAAAAAGGCCGRCQQPLGGRWGGARGSPFLAVAAGQRFWRRAGLPPPLPLRAAAAAAASGPWAAGGGGRGAARFWRALRVRVFGAAPGSRRRCRWLLLPLPVAPGRPVGGSAGQPVFGGRCGSAFLGPRRAAAAAAATGGCRGRCQRPLGGRWGGARGSPFLAGAAGPRFWGRAGLPPPLPLRAAAAAAAGGPWAAGGGGRGAARFWRAPPVRVFGAAPGCRRRCRYGRLPRPQTAAADVAAGCCCCRYRRPLCGHSRFCGLGGCFGGHGSAAPPWRGRGRVLSPVRVRSVVTALVAA